MADSGLTGLTELTTDPAADDWFYVVDKSDTTDDPAGSSRKIPANRALGILTQQNGGLSPSGTKGYAQLGGYSAGFGGSHVPGPGTVFSGGIIVVFRDITITDACLIVETAQANSNVRLGIYNANQSTGKATTLVSDLGLVDTSVLGRREITGLSVALTPGLYWTVYCTEDSSRPGLRHGPIVPYPFAGDTGTGISQFLVNQYRSDSGINQEVNGFDSDITAWSWATASSSSSPGHETRIYFKWTNS